ncbi:MAG: YncE family protein, partial [Bacteroidales bacterium]|nr:YncE family protein [Bacteroidales bacterium]
KNNKLWVLSDGGFEGSPYGHEKPAITRIDAASFTVEQVYEFPDINHSPSKLCLNGTKDTLYYINGGWGSSGLSGSGIFCMPVRSTTLPSTPLIPENNKLFYGLGVDPQKSIIYTSDAIDYMQNGIVFRYTAAGEKIDSFQVGVSPGSFCFKP